MHRSQKIIILAQSLYKNCSQNFVHFSLAELFLLFFFLLKPFLNFLFGFGSDRTNWISLVHLSLSHFTCTAKKNIGRKKYSSKIIWFFLRLSIKNPFSTFRCSRWIKKKSPNLTDRPRTKKMRTKHEIPSKNRVSELFSDRETKQGAYTHCDQTTVTTKTKLKSLNIVFFVFLLY